jgi:hypothetical protein
MITPFILSSIISERAPSVVVITGNECYIATTLTNPKVSFL